jgi:hypothetical protein
MSHSRTPGKLEALRKLHGGMGLPLRDLESGQSLSKGLRQE